MSKRMNLTRRPLRIRRREELARLRRSLREHADDPGLDRWLADRDFVTREEFEDAVAVAVAGLLAAAAGRPFRWAADRSSHSAADRPCRSAAGRPEAPGRSGR